MCVALVRVFLRACRRALIHPVFFFSPLSLPADSVSVQSDAVRHAQHRGPKEKAVSTCKIHPPASPQKKTAWKKKKPSHTSRRVRAHHRHIGEQSTKVRQTGLSGPDGRAGSADTLNNLTLTSAVNGDKC